MGQQSYHKKYPDGAELLGITFTPDKPGETVKLEIVGLPVPAGPLPIAPTLPTQRKLSPQQQRTADIRKLVNQHFPTVKPTDIEYARLMERSVSIVDYPKCFPRNGSISYEDAVTKPQYKRSYGKAVQSELDRIWKSLHP